MAVKKKAVVLEFEREKATKNKQRFAEVGENPTVGVLYVTKKTDESLGEPDSLRVTIEPGS